MNRKGVNLLLVEIISFTAFGLTIVIWFTGIESLVGSLDENLAVKNFNKFLQPIRSVCENGGQSKTFGLNLNVLGETNIVTQLKVPSDFQDDLEEYNRLPLRMRKCVGETCVCLLTLRESEGNWQMCTTSLWDFWAMGTGMSPGCPFWFYAPPDIVDQVISNMLSMIDLSTSFTFSLLTDFNDDITKGVDRNYFYYAAPETWGGCVSATEDDLLLSSFFKNKGSFTCTDATIKNKMLSSCYNSLNKNFPIINDLVNEEYVYDKDFLNESSTNKIIKPLENELRDELINALDITTNDFKNKLRQREINILTSVYDDKKLDLRQKVADLISDLKLTDKTKVLDIVTELNVQNDLLVNQDEEKTLAENIQLLLVKELENNLVRSDYEYNLLFSSVDLDMINSVVKTVLKKEYIDLKDDLWTRTVFDEKCELSLDVNEELDTFKKEVTNPLSINIKDLLEQTLLTKDDLVTELDKGINPDNYDFTTVKNGFAQSITNDLIKANAEVIAKDLSTKLWDKVEPELINQGCSSPLSIKDSFINELSTILEEPLNIKLQSEDLTSDFSSDDFSINKLKNELINAGSRIYQDKIQGLINDFLNNWFYQDFSDYSLSFIINKINSQLYNSISSVISESRMNSWDGLDFRLGNCWLGPNGYIQGVVTINDLLAFNQFTSVSRIEPTAIFAGGNPLYKLPSMGFYQIHGSIIGDETDFVIKKIQEKGPMSVEDFNRLLDETDTIDVSQLTSAFTYNTQPITGLFLGTVLGKFEAESLLAGFREALFDAIKDALGIPENEGIYGLINLPNSSIILTYEGTLSRRITYSDGAIRTFDPNKINAVSCFTMDELGCPKDKVLWVDEQKSCYTELFMRNIGDISTWLKLLLKSDDCLNSYGRETCNAQELSGDGVCYKDTLTACYKMTCVQNKPDDIRRVFQYWIGSESDPAGIGGPMTSQIPELDVKEDDGKIVLEVPNKGMVPLIE